MPRLFAYLLVVLAPLGAFAWWVMGPVQARLYHGSPTMGILLMLAGLAALALVEGALFKFWLIPLCARVMSERFSSGSYLPEDDPLVRLVAEVSQDPQRLPELVRLVESDPQRTRGWLELARMMERDAPAQAVEKLCQGAQKLRHNKEEAALLMWRAITLAEKHPELAEKASTLLSELASAYPETSYGQLALKRVPSHPHKEEEA